MAKKELPGGWINKKRYYMFMYGSWGVLFLGFAILLSYDMLIKPLAPLSIILWGVVIFIVNMMFKNSIMNKERMEVNKPMIELIRNIEGNEALKAVDEMLSRDDLSSSMIEKYKIEKVYTLLYLDRTKEAKELLDTIQRPKLNNNLFIYIELGFELSDNPKALLEKEYEYLEGVTHPQFRASIQGVLEYRQAILEAEETGKPSESLREMLFTQKDIFTMLMNQYRIIRIYRNVSKAITREACEKIIEYGNDLLRFTNLANKVVNELGPVTEEEKLEAEKIHEIGNAFMTFDDEDNDIDEIENEDVIEAEIHEEKEDNNQ